MKATPLRCVGLVLVAVSCGSSESKGSGGAASDAATDASGSSGAGGAAGSGGTAGTHSDSGIDATADVSSDAVQDVVSDVSPDGDPVPATWVFASPDGSGNACTEADPCSLNTARDVVRALTSGMTENVGVQLRGGVYRLDSTFELTSLDSGTNGFSVVYRAYPGEVPVLSGGREVYGFTLWDAVKGIVRAQVPPTLRSRQLYVNGRRAQRARGALHPAGWTETAAGYEAPDAWMSSWEHPDDDVEIVQLLHWKNFRCSVASAQGTTVVMDQPCWELAQLHAGFDMGVPTWVENARELLDLPGEWYLDEHEDFIYYVLAEGETASSIEVVVPRLETLVSVQGTLDDPVHDIRLQGLTFSHATWMGPSSAQGYPALQAGYYWTGSAANPSQDIIPGNVVLRRAVNVEVSGNTFEHLGGYALALEYGCHDVSVVGNLIHDVSAGGIRVGETNLPNTTDPREVVTNTLVRSNHVRDTGREYFDGVGIFAGYTDGTRILNNVLRNLSYSAISVGWGWSTSPTVARNNEVGFNRASHAMQRLHDGGMTYTLSTQPDSRIHDNHFHDQVHVYGSIYLDQGSMHFDVTRNVIASAPYWFILQPVVPPPAQQNVVRFNFSDTSESYCCGGLGCCTDINTVSDNTVFPPGQWPPEARHIIHRAGLEPGYRGLLGGTLRIEAEDYAHGGEGVSHHDLTAGNDGGRHREDDVDVYACASCSNDATVGYTQTGEWLDYHVDADFAGRYALDFRVGTQSADCGIEVTVDGVYVGTVGLPDTGSWNAFQTASLPDFRLNPGVHRVRLAFTGGFNFDWFELRAKTSACSGAVSSTLQGSFDGSGATNTLDIYGSDACWTVSSGGGARPWLLGWGATSSMRTGDFDGDGLDDVLLIDPAGLQWHLALSTGTAFTPFPQVLVGWGAGHHNVVGDLDGDGKDDVTVIYNDGTTWRWHVAGSVGHSFVSHPNAHLGTDPGSTACARDIDNDGLEEVIVSGVGQGMCGHYDAATAAFAVVEACAETCN